MIYLDEDIIYIEELRDILNHLTYEVIELVDIDKDGTMYFERRVYGKCE